MRYFIIPIIDSQPDISENDRFDLLFYIGDNKTVYGALIDGVVRNSWQEISEDEFERYIMENSESPTYEKSITAQLEEQQSKLDTIEMRQALMMSLLMEQYGDVLESNASDE